MPNKQRFIIIDSHALIHRAYHALPPLATKKGELVNAVYGFLLVFLKVLREFSPDYIAATFDMPEPTFRHKEFEEYKATRPKAPQELYSQIPLVKRILKAFNVPIFEKAGFEADDLIGFLSKNVLKREIFPEIETIIVSGDLDTLQLVDKNIKVYTLRKGMQDTVIYGPKEVEERFNLKPEQLPDFKGLKGDPSDNIPGVPGVGEKIAIELIKKYGSLENLYKNLERSSFEKDFKKYSGKVKENLLSFKDQAIFSKMLATIREDVPLKFNLKECKYQTYDPQKVREILKELEFQSLLDKIPQTKITSQHPPSLDDSRKNMLVEIENLYKEKIISKKIYELEKSLLPVIEDMERWGIKVDPDQLKVISEILGGKIQKQSFKIYNLAGEHFNINSPLQLSRILFEKLRIPTTSLRKTPGGVVSTSFPELEKIKDEYPILRLVQEVRGLAKLKTGFVDALPKLISSQDGRLHPRFYQLGTVTGRISCRNPNLQNIPTRREWGQKIRRAFVAEKNFHFISFDYSQMELRIAAHISDDQKMIEAFNRGEDIHRLTASEIYNISQDKVTQDKRDQAKILNFGILYGISIRNFALSASISYKEAKRFFKEYQSDFKGITTYIRGVKDETRKRGYTETLLGRKSFLPQINSEDLTLRTAAERMAINHPIQGSAADIMKLAMVKVYNFLSKNYKNFLWRLILQIHDELLFEIRDDIIIEMAPQIKQIMEGVYKLKIPLEVDIKIGKNWGDMVEYKAYET